MPVKTFWLRFIDFHRKLNWWKKCLFYFLITIALHWLYLLILIFFHPPITTTQLSSLIQGYGLNRNYVSISEISKNAGLAVIAAEDQVFADHFGLDYESIEKAIEFNNTHSKRKRGASTISQQVAKNVFLWQGRSWFRKGLEVYFTFMIEMLWSKKRILDIYLNSVEMGKGIFGIEAASNYFFHKNASKLNRTEAAFIAACLPNPKKFKANNPSNYIIQRKDWILNQMEMLDSDPEIKELIEKMGN